MRLATVDKLGDTLKIAFLCRARPTHLGVAESKVKRVLDHADATRHARLSAGLGALPDPWPHGEPLRVGDRAAFTGCDETQRLRLEQRAEQLGVRVISSVSRLTVMLITDGSFAGGKLAKSQELGIRQVHPDVFDVLLQHLQHLQPAASLAPPPSTEPHRPASAETRGPSLVSPSAVRAWAVSAGLDIGVRGRIPKHVIDAYAAAH